MSFRAGKEADKTRICIEPTWKGQCPSTIQSSWRKGDPFSPSDHLFQQDSELQQTAIPTKQCLVGNFFFFNHWKHQNCKENEVIYVFIHRVTTLQINTGRFCSNLLCLKGNRHSQLGHRKQACFPERLRKVLMGDDSWMPRNLGNEDAWFALHSAIWFGMGRNKVVIAICKLAYFTVQ